MGSVENKEVISPRTHYFISSQLSPFLSPNEKNKIFHQEKNAICWKEASNFLRSERLCGYAYTIFGQEEYSDSVPPEILWSWQKSWKNTWRRAQRQLLDLKSALKYIGGLGIPVMVMKGPIFVEKLHSGDYGCRPFCDIDLVIPEKYVSAFIEGIYSWTEKNLYPLYEPLTSRFHFRMGRTVFETHWNLSLFYSFNRSQHRASNQDSIWERASKSQYRWGECYCMSDIDMLVHQTAHAVIQHDLQFHSLLFAIDFAKTVRILDPSVTPDQVIQCADKQKYPTALKAMAMATLEIVPGSDSSSLLVKLADNGHHGLKSRVLRQVQVYRKSKIRSELGQVADMTHTMACFMDGWDNRIGFLRQILLPSHYTLCETYHVNLSRLGYVMAILFHFLMLPAFTTTVYVLISRQLQDFLRSLCKQC